VVVESGAAPDATAGMLAAGPTAVLLKPFAPAELVAAIARLIDGPAPAQRIDPAP
jgi:DNA-binding NarL/FixJ family response regulator